MRKRTVAVWMVLLLIAMLMNACTEKILYVEDLPNTSGNSANASLPVSKQSEDVSGKETGSDIANSSNPQSVSSPAQSTVQSGSVSSESTQSASGSAHSSVESLPATESPDPSGVTLPTTESENPSSAIPDKQETGRVSVLAAGDNLLHKSILQDANEKAANDGTFYFDDIYRYVTEQIQKADLSVINQETIAFSMAKVGGKAGWFTNSKVFNNGSGAFASPGQIIDSLARAGFDAIGMANNHMLDAGSAPIYWSLEYIANAGLTAFGGYRSQADMQNIRVVEKNGIRIALLAYTYGTELKEETARRDDPTTDFAIPYINDEQILADLSAAKEKADFTFVFLHWGEEENTESPAFMPTQEQRRLAKLMAENGAGIIVGHHSHALQPIEYISDGNGGEVLCAYSLGTLVSNMVDAWNVLSGFFSFDIVKWDDGSVTVENPVLTPTVCYYNSDHRDYALYYLKDYTEALASSHWISDGNMTLPKLYEYLHQAIDSAFLPPEYQN